MTDTSGLAAALSGPAPSRLLRLGIVEAVNDTAVPPTLTINSRPMRYVNRVPIGQAALYVDEGQDPVVLGKLSEGDDGVPVGGVTEYGGSVVPPGWLLCDGRSTSGYPKLAAVVGSNVPDLRGLFVIGAGNGYTLGGTGGAATVTLTSAQNGQHAHTIGSHSHDLGTHSHTIGSHGHSFSGSTGGVGDHSHNMPLSSIKTGPHDHNNEGGRLSEAPAAGFGGALTFMGSAGGHSHSVSGSVGSTSLGTGFTDIGRTGDWGLNTAADPPSATASHENRPPYYVLTRIIRAS